jgi:hypothetical protein
MSMGVEGTTADQGAMDRVARPEPPGEAQHAFHAHKLELGEQAPREAPRTIPWAYGEDRVTGLAVDPDRLFVYWEVTDLAMERARQALGRGGPGAWLNLRVYDTTGRIFDGTNAHSYFDRRVERDDRQYFFDIGKPSSEAFVEVGLRSHEGYFVKIARSGRVSFPRRAPAEWRQPEWMTVRVATGDIDPGAQGGVVPGAGAHGGGGSAAGASGPGFGAEAPTPGGDPVPLWRMHLPWQEVLRRALELEEHFAWEEMVSHGFADEHHAIFWEGPTLITSWEAGPFTYPVEVAPPSTEVIAGPVRVYEAGGRTHIVHGPWRMVIRGLDAHRGHQIIARWEVHRSWRVDEKHSVRVVAAAGARPARAGASELLGGMGASELRQVAASELRLSGASELHFLGASERRLAGASERLSQAASQWLMRGASERRVGGASERLLRGGSEQVARGASERLRRGASERLHRGASERLRRGASERLGGAGSEKRLGGSSDESYPPPPEAGAEPK